MAGAARDVMDEAVTARQVWRRAEAAYGLRRLRLLAPPTLPWTPEQAFLLGFLEPYAREHGIEFDGWNTVMEAEDAGFALSVIERAIGYRVAFRAERQ